jgi:LacI family transcriptional regulator
LPKVTLEDISQNLNISKNTVSKALRGAPGVSDELRDKIVNLADELGYKKGTNSLNNSVNNLINVTIICRKSFLAEVTFWSQVLYGISNYASEKNVKVSIESIDDSRENKPETIASILNHESDGCIIVGIISDKLFEKIKAANIPMVVVDHFNEDIDCDYIHAANKQGIYKGIKYLYENNHRNIGFITNSISDDSFSERYDAYIKYMNKLQLAIKEECVFLDAVYLDTSYYKNKIENLKKCKALPTAWICANDTIALTFSNALMEMDYKIPDDFSIIGFDNISEFLYPGLTTINVPKQEMGEKALEKLLKRIENPDSIYENIMLNTELVKRQSVKNIKREEY